MRWFLHLPATQSLIPLSAATVTITPETGVMPTAQTQYPCPANKEFADLFTKNLTLFSPSRVMTSFRSLSQTLAVRSDDPEISVPVFGDTNRLVTEAAWAWYSSKRGLELAGEKARMVPSWLPV